MTITRIPEDDLTGVKTNVWRVILDAGAGGTSYLWLASVILIDFGESVNAVTLISTDAGLTFEARDAIVDSYMYSPVSYDIGGLTTIAALSSASTGANRVDHSEDLGITWAIGSTIAMSSINILVAGQSVLMIGSNYGYLSISTDNGLTWSSNTLPVGAGTSINGIAHNGVDTFIIAANGPSLAISTDIGGTWAALTYAGIYNPNSISYGNGTWLTVANVGEVTISTDAGATWTSTGGFTAARLETAEYDSSSATWFIAARNGEIWSSSDGGTTWVASYDSADNINFYRLTADGLGTVVAIGYNDTTSAAVYFRSGDSGATWAEVDLSSYAAGDVDEALFFTVPA